jgi:RecA-family ATPase
MPTYRQNNRFASKGTLPKRTLEYLARGSSKGTRNQELFSAACQFRDAGYTIDEAMPRLFDRALKDQLSEPEARKAIESGYTRGARDPLGPDSNSHANNANSAANGPSSATTATGPAAGFHVVGSSIPLPDPIPDGFARLLTAAFEPDEYVSIAEAEEDGAGNWIPKAGQVLKRDKWLDAYKSGRLAKIFPENRGVFIRINPMKPGGKSDNDVAVFRHALVESDLDENGNRIPLATQWETFVRSGLPFTAISFSGDKSLHGLVRLDAADRSEFDSRRIEVWEIFKNSNFDPQNKNPSRYSRAPGFQRTLYDEAGKPCGTAKQELLALGIGPKDWATYVHQSKVHLPEIIAGERLRSEVLPLPDDIISGLIAHGEKGELCGGTKSYKTWTLIDQALAVATGSEWWGLKTASANVIYLNLEIPRAFFETRLREIAGLRAIAIPDNFSVWHLRGINLANPDRWDEFIDQLADYCAGLERPYLVTDPVYKLLAGRNENAAGDVERLLWQIEEMLQSCGGTNFFGHHFAKGDSTVKVAIDRMAGSGVFARDPDSVFVMTPHAKTGCFVIEPILRNHQPLEPFVVEWRKPIFVRDDSLDPGTLAKGGTRAKPGPKPKFAPSIIAQLIGKDFLSKIQIKKLVMDETGMSKSLFYDLFAEADKGGLIVFDGISKTWEVPGK